MFDSLNYIVMSRRVIDDGYGLTTLKEHIAHVNSSHAQAVEAIRTWRSTDPEAARIWPFFLGGLLYTPHAVPELDEALLDAITALASDAPSALRRVPKGLASVMDAEVVVRRLSESLGTLSGTEDARVRIEHLASLAEHALQAFDQAVRPETKVGYQQHWLRDLASSMRQPLAHILLGIVRALPQASVDRSALFSRLWAWLRMGWLDEFRYVKFDATSVARHNDWSDEIASILDTREALQEAVKVLRAETKTVQASPTFRPLLFALFTRLEDPDAMVEALPASPEWQRHEAIVHAYEKQGRSADAITYLNSLRASPDKDALLRRLLRETASPEEAFASEHPHPSNLAALMERYGKTKSELIDVGLERMRRGEENDWLEFLVRESEWKRALLATKAADPELVLRLLTTALPPATAHELARTCLEHVLDTKKVWSNATRAKEVVALLLNQTLALAPDAKSRAKALKQARSRVDKVIAKSTDFFTRELAFALEDALTKHEAS
jgi:hypothetical protein